MLEKGHSMERIVLHDHSFEKLELDHSKELEIVVNENAKASLYITLKGDLDVKCHILVKKEAQLDLLTWNESECILFNSEIVCESNSLLNLNLGELSEGSVHEVHRIHLKGEGSRLEMRSANCVDSKKILDIECIHEAPYTSSHMENYAVVNEKGELKLTDNGRILKGAYGSSSHQTSRALILSDEQQCEITPVLLIDENDVQASHATTMGQIDENQLYYLQTRGLTKTQALGLITIGYLMPIASSLNDEGIVDDLTQKIEKRVGLS